MGKSIERKDFFGNKYTEDIDDDGNKIGESREREDFFGNKYIEHVNNHGDKIGESREREGFFGNKYTEHIGNWHPGHKVEQNQVNSAEPYSSGEISTEGSISGQLGDGLGTIIFSFGVLALLVLMVRSCSSPSPQDWSRSAIKHHATQRHSGVAKTKRVHPTSLRYIAGSWTSNVSATLNGEGVTWRCRYYLSQAGSRVTGNSTCIPKWDKFSNDSPTENSNIDGQIVGNNLYWENGKFKGVISDDGQHIYCEYTATVTGLDNNMRYVPAHTQVISYTMEKQ